MHWKLSPKFVSNFCENANDVKKEIKILLLFFFTLHKYNMNNEGAM